MERRIFPEGKDDHPRNPRLYEDYRWSRFNNFAPADMYELISEHVFLFLRKAPNCSRKCRMRGIDRQSTGETCETGINGYE
jgi:hypothetical protein